MSLHEISGRRSLGFVLALTTALMWGILPIALKVLLDGMDSITIIWYRFLTSGVLLAIWLRAANGPVSFEKFKIRGVAILMAIAVIGLNSNYLFYMLGLDYINPSAAVVVVQLAPFFFMIGALYVFKERFNLRQYVGAAMVLIGLAMFFNNRLGELVSMHGKYTLGVFFIFASALTWAAYAMAQKQLLKHFPSQTIMVVIYLFGAIAFLPMSHPGAIMNLDGVRLFLLVFCAVNTLFAYGTFSEALAHLEASRVSAVLAIIPLVTMVSMKVAEKAWPSFIKPEGLNVVSLVGGLVLAAGSIMTSIGSEAGKIEAPE